MEWWVTKASQKTGVRGCIMGAFTNGVIGEIESIAGGWSSHFWNLCGLDHIIDYDMRFLFCILFFS